MVRKVKSEENNTLSKYKVVHQIIPDWLVVVNIQLISIIREMYVI